ncbi:MAG TPA: glycosyltransferase family 2 protein [Methanothrix soehngenii]|nr:glycosyltransferase family 2 protein [Methanothrix soehngenii]
MRNKIPSIVALLPAYNEEVSIGSVVLRTRQYADRVVVIDDGSRDRTAEVAAMAGAEVLRHTKNQGKGAALKTGFGSVNGESVIVTIDTDGQHNPDDTPRLVEPILSGKAAGQTVKSSIACFLCSHETTNSLWYSIFTLSMATVQIWRRYVGDHIQDQS